MSSVSNFLWSIALTKGLKNAVKAFLAAYGIHLATAGITVDQAALVGFLTGALETGRNYLKQRRGWTWL